jgi:adenylate cyclase
MAEDIIAGLSKFRWLFVIARNSSFTYKGRPVDVRQLARELGVRYVLEGSIRKGGDRIRVTAQLIDALAGNPIWSERYDRGLEDLFALQDEITETWWCHRAGDRPGRTAARRTVYARQRRYLVDFPKV